MGEEFTAVIAEVWRQLKSCIATVKGEPMLLLPFGVSFAGAMIGLTKRFFRFKH